MYVYIYIYIYTHIHIYIYIHTYISCFTALPTLYPTPVYPSASSLLLESACSIFSPTPVCPMSSQASSMRTSATAFKSSTCCWSSHSAIGVSTYSLISACLNLSPTAPEHAQRTGSWQVYAQILEGLRSDLGKPTLRSWQAATLRSWQAYAQISASLRSDRGKPTLRSWLPTLRMLWDVHLKTPAKMAKNDLVSWDHGQAGSWHGQ